jgi:hypothetical protein
MQGDDEEILIPKDRLRRQLNLLHDLEKPVKQGQNLQIQEEKKQVNTSRLNRLLKELDSISNDV